LKSLNVSLINRQAPYPIQELAPNRYQFVTEVNILYHFVFDEDEPIGGVPTYQFSIVNVSNMPPSNDGKVKRLTMAVLENFFENNDFVILYICDTSDGRQSVRTRLFQKWFKEFDIENKYLILADSIVDENIKNEFGIIIQRSNPAINAVITDFNNMTEAFRENK